MFLSLEGLLIGLALVGVALAAGAALSALTSKPRPQPVTVRVIRQRSALRTGPPLGS